MEPFCDGAIYQMTKVICFNNGFTFIIKHFIQTLSLNLKFEKGLHPPPLCQVLLATCLQLPFYSSACELLKPVFL